MELTTAERIARNLSCKNRILIHRLFILFYFFCKQFFLLFTNIKPPRKVAFLICSFLHIGSCLHQSFPHSIRLLLITHLLSCCKHPVKILIKAACKYSSSRYSIPTGFLQNDRKWLIICQQSFSGHSKRFNPPAICYALACHAASIL